MLWPLNPRRSSLHWISTQSKCLSTSC